MLASQDLPNQAVGCLSPIPPPQCLFIQVNRRRGHCAFWVRDDSDRVNDLECSVVASAGQRPRAAA